MIQKLHRSIVFAAPMLWAVSVALLVQIFSPVSWWHPNCQNNSIGIIEYPASGVPFPYVQGSPIFSVEWDFMPYVLLGNVAVITAALFFIFKLTFRQNLRSPAPAYGALVLLSFVVLFMGAAYKVGGFHVVKSIAQEGESYFDYRPRWALHDNGDSRCFSSRAVQLGAQPDVPASGRSAG